MALDDGTDAPIIFPGFSSTSSEHDESPRKRSSSSKKTPIYSISKKKRRFETSVSPQRRRSSSSKRQPLLLSGTKGRLSYSKSSPLDNNNHNQHKHHHKSTPSRPTATYGSKRRHHSHSADKKRLEAVARLPPPPPQHLQESDETTTSTTRHLHTNNTNTTTTEITSNVHLKRKAHSSNLSIILSDTEEQHPPPFDTTTSSPELQTTDQRQHSKRRQRQSFQVKASAPCLSLIEGMEIDLPLDKYMSRVLEGRPCNHPRIGRLMELPCEAVQGQWTAEISSSRTASATSTTRMVLRHQSRRHLGILKTLKRKHDLKPMTTMPTRDAAGPLPTTTANHASTATPCLSNRVSSTATAATSGTSPLTITSMQPSLNRYTCLDYQDVLDMEQDPSPFIGSLSIVSFEGFTSTTEMNSRAAEVSTRLLQHIENNIQDEQPYPCLLGVHSSASTHTNTQTPIGVSAMCGLSLERGYDLWIAQDGSLPGNPVVALDLVFGGLHPDRDTNPVSTAELAGTNQASEEGDPYRLTEQRLKAHTLAARSTPYDPLQRLWGANNNTDRASRNYHHHPNKRPKLNRTTADATPTTLPATHLPSSPKRKTTKPTIKIRNAAAIFARANELACKQAAAAANTAKLATDPSPQPTIPSRMVTPHTIGPAVLLGSAPILPSRPGLGLQQEDANKPGGPDPYKVEEEFDDDDDDDDSDTMSCDEDEDIDAEMIMTRHLNHYHLHHPTHATASIQQHHLPNHSVPLSMPQPETPKLSTIPVQNHPVTTSSIEMAVPMAHDDNDIIEANHRPRISLSPQSPHDIMVEQVATNNLRGSCLPQSDAPVAIPSVPILTAAESMTLQRAGTTRAKHRKWQCRPKHRSIFMLGTAAIMKIAITFLSIVVLPRPMTPSSWSHPNYCRFPHNNKQSKVVAADGPGVASIFF